MYPGLGHLAIASVPSHVRTRMKHPWISEGVSADAILMGHRHFLPQMINFCHQGVHDSRPNVKWCTGAGNMAKSKRTRRLNTPIETGTDRRSHRSLLAGGLGVVIGGCVMALAFLATPLGDYCRKPIQITITKMDGQNAAPKLAQKEPPQRDAGKQGKAESGKPTMPDPMAELRRIEAMNAQNRRLMGLEPQRSGLPGQPAIPHMPRPTEPAIPNVPQPFAP